MVIASGASEAEAVSAVAVIVALALTGSVSARLGRAPKLRPSLRTIRRGILPIAVTYAIGVLVGG
jgi:VIT1/CCC1 family predicted Fe2+/Mn2+ transporter